MTLTKLDTYEYMILPGVIRISIQGKADADLVDILSEIFQSDGRIYVDDNYYSYLGEYHIFEKYEAWYLDLEVELLEIGGKENAQKV